MRATQDLERFRREDESGQAIAPESMSSQDSSAALAGIDEALIIVPLDGSVPGGR